LPLAAKAGDRDEQDQKHRHEPRKYLTFRPEERA
jgi:hypothetical protein